MSVHLGYLHTLILIGSCCLRHIASKSENTRSIEDDEGDMCAINEVSNQNK